MKGLLARLTRSALDAVFPIHCLGCGREGKFLCGLCMAGMPRLTLPYCPVCARPGYRRLCDWCERSPVAVDGIRAPFLYVEGSLIQRAIVDFKLQRTHAMAPELARVLAEYLHSNPMPGGVIVPVPSHSRRLRSRGFNQAVLLGRELGKITGLPVNENLIVQTRDTPSQRQMAGRAERWNNVAGSFSCTGDGNGQSVLLVDDIATTGATMSACAGALKDAGASQVWGLAVARPA